MMSLFIHLMKHGEINETVYFLSRVTSMIFSGAYTAKIFENPFDHWQSAVKIFPFSKVVFDAIHEFSIQH